MITEYAPVLSQSEMDAYDAALDHLVDTRGISYDDARRELGEPPYEVYEIPEMHVTRPMGGAASREVVERPKKRRSGRGPQYGEEEGIGYPNGRPPYYQPYEPLSVEQQRINARGLNLVRETLAEKKAIVVDDEDQPQ